jgi:hypothetical protein
MDSPCNLKANFAIPLTAIMILKEKNNYIKVENQNESEVKRKSAITFVIALFFLVAGTRISFISFRMDVIG